jgi:hypothetical protein
MEKFRLRMKDRDLEPEDACGAAGDQCVSQENGLKSENRHQFISGCGFAT